MNAIEKKDTNLINKSYDNLYKVLDSLEEREILAKTELIPIFNKLIDELSITSPDFEIKKILRRYKCKCIQYVMYLNMKENYYEETIRNYKNLQKDSLFKFMDAPNRLNRMHDLGVSYNKIGEIQKAKKTYHETLDFAKKVNSDDDIARATINFSALFNWNEDFDSTIIYSNQIINKAIAPKYKASLSLNLADAYIGKKEFSKALGYSNQALNLLQSIDSAKRPDNFSERLSNTYKIFANIYEQQHNYVNADEAYTKALDYRYQEDSTGRDLAKLYIAIGNYKELFPQSKFKETPLVYYNKALKALQNNFNEKDSLALPDINRLTPENAYFEALDAKADYLYKRDANHVSNLKKILEYYTASFKVERLLLNNFVYDDSKISFLDESRLRTDKALQICYTLYQKTKEQQWLDKAFQYIENNKATILSQKIKQSNITTSAMLEDSLVVQQKEIKRKLTEEIEYRNTLDITSHTPVVDSTIKVLDSTINTLTKQEEELNTILKEKYPNLNQLYTFNDSITIKEIQNNLNTKTGIIQYFYKDSILYTISITNQEVQFIQKQINSNLISAFKQNCGDLSFQLNQPQQFINESAALYANIFPQQIFNKSIEEIILIPDGVLNSISFDALIEKDNGNYSSYKKQAYLSNRYSLEYAYSYTSVQQKNSNKSNNSKSDIIAFAPAYNKALDSKAILPNAEKEIVAIQKSYSKCKTFVGNQATQDQFVKNYSNASIIHLATHSQADQVHGNSSIDFYDEKMYTNQFYAYDDFKADLVFLSACETTVGRNTESEGVLSLARSIYYAGAKNVISAQWNINDQSTNTIVENFYKNTKEYPYGKSLQKAKQQYLETCSPEKAAPYYWAALTHIGADNVPESNFKVIFLYIGAFVLVLAIAFLLHKRSKK